MRDPTTVQTIRSKYVALLDDLDERGRRRWAAAEARALGHGGITAVALATGLSDRTIRTGVRELDDPEPLAGHRQRRAGGGRKPHATARPGLRDALDRLIEPTARGSPTSPLRWTIKSTYRLADELRSQGHAVSATSVRRMLVEMKYSLQGNRKTLEGAQHPDRDGQFRHISERVQARKRRGEPALSVDTKKKEVLGNLKNAGRTYRPRGAPEEVKTHDFPDPRLGKAVPYGVYDIHGNVAGVSVGISHDRAEFAVGAIGRWWEKLGRARYPRARRILVTADSGGSNSSRSRLWKRELQAFADGTGLIVEVCHYPPGTSKWNKIEHQLSSHITLNWQGRPLTSHQIVVDLISATTTRTGVTVHAEPNMETYPRGIKVTNAEMEAISPQLKAHAFHRDRNYTLRPPTTRL